MSWNCTLIAFENIPGNWSQPRGYSLSGKCYIWDVSRAVAHTYSLGESMRPALYSTDGEYHLGKYFWFSDSGDWIANAWHTLRVMYCLPFRSPEIDCSIIYMPVILH